MDRKIKVLIAKVGLDGHDRGAKVVARGLKDEGFEVIYTGLRQSPEQIVRSAIQEDADVIGISILSGAHLELVPLIMDRLRKQGINDVVVLVGGVIPPEDVEKLKQIGVDGVFPPGSSLKEMAKFIREKVGEKRGITVGQ